MTIHNIKQLTVKEICTLIKEYTTLLGQMVGTLYPRIVQDDINQLKEQYYKLTGRNYD